MEAVQRALDEDLQSTGDITSRALIQPGSKGRAEIVMREPGVVAGLPLASMVFRLLDNKVNFRSLVNDGEHLHGDSVIATLDGSVLTILEGERTALNFLQKLSGIASLTAKFVALAAPYGAEILDTRKTTPGMRELEKYAVRAGGGKNHRFGLYDAVLIKDNHIAATGGVGKAVLLAKEAGEAPGPIEVEVGRLEELEEAIEAGADIVMLDNMPPEDVEQAVRVTSGRVKLEASGGITLENVSSYARTGVDFISVGAITHSAASLDIALQLQAVKTAAGERAN
ncbi:MAG: nicotinate-nucleotide diphosphorylase (carboxylating) [Candidatus Solincola sediminis]|uniref:Nicotinate-nucleotide pyrophosphorylase [carboxylating] n=1 Tax=Candidatus Solincola sediminis TaxID=1797199 RepID=A0A1F2WQE1_9ACTN|nr:MAG: nicotinate-nucleotide diphosphorylase (carboxylating) [Candidatus Solincola sediminis]OFW61504.1 MAG: nicotinate-nucleotide diphosphorylase (carboxylating) [Candidatus Solincola sediminis]